MNQKQLELERDLYRLLLQVGNEYIDDIDKTLTSALNLIVQITCARIGYIELRNPSGKKWWSTYHCSEVEIATIQDRISFGIIAEAISSNRTIFTPSAFLDPRFLQRESVQSGRIESVLCSPFNDGETIGVVYLQGDMSAELDSENSMMETELFTRHITPLLKYLKYKIDTTKVPDDLRKKYKLDSIIGDSTAMHKVLKEAMVIAEIDVTALITGETGTGKNLLARAIHQNSHRCNKPFVHINCSALPESLVESELFGAVKGAHSSAFFDVKGKIAAANGGTLFLDEIGELSLSVQTKFLQFLEEGYYYPLGSQTLSKPDVRVITASNKDFSAAIAQGSFREDLFYRINVFPIEMPPLRKRADDIARLAEFFISLYCKQFNMPVLELTDQTAQMLKESNWPGNVREMENKIQQGIIRAKAESACTIQIKHILSGEKQSEPSIEPITYRQGKESWEKDFIETKLQQNNWNISETAKALDLSRSHMNNLIKLHKLERANGAPSP
jgi:Nif-specific regulatory protein